MAANDDNIKLLTKLINESYRIGEKGIFTDTADIPFLRHTIDEVVALVAKEKLLILVDSDDTIIGCVKADPGLGHTCNISVGTTDRC